MIDKLLDLRLNVVKRREEMGEAWYERWIKVIDRKLKETSDASV
jgi:hypothetical protein